MKLVLSIPLIHWNQFRHRADGSITFLRNVETLENYAVQKSKKKNIPNARTEMSTALVACRAVS